jgi:hypothetical protein
MKTYVLLVLLFLFSSSSVWAQHSSGMAYRQSGTKTEGGDEQLQVKVFPNPFPEQVQFQFDITETSPVTLIIFDITGNKIAVLVDQVLEKDSYKLGWKPAQLLSGMYVYVLSAGKTRKTGKIILLNNRI